ncbi:hypothetical protein M0R19_02670 [Candidatus Pacearchaeota archaeon]|nr:hypothetical protein [Candidatus Pacearchaeota archaeon]
MFKKRGCFVIIVLLVLVLGSFAVSAAKLHNANDILVRIGVSNMTLQSLAHYNVSLKLIDTNGLYDSWIIGSTSIPATCNGKDLDCEDNRIWGWYDKDNNFIKADDCGGLYPNKEYACRVGSDDYGSDWYDCNEEPIIIDNCGNIGVDNEPSSRSTGIKGWYDDNNNLILEDNTCNAGLLGIGKAHIKCTPGLSYNNTFPSNIHNASQVWVSVKDGQMTLAQALISEHKLCNISGAAQVLSIPAGNKILEGKYHYANETEIKIRGTTMKLQDAINQNKFCYTYRWNSTGWGSCSATCGGGTKSEMFKCIREDKVIVNDDKCPTPKPTNNANCNTQHCEWRSDGSGCRATGAGIFKCSDVSGQICDDGFYWSKYRSDLGSGSGDMTCYGDWGCCASSHSYECNCRLACNPWYHCWWDCDTCTWCDSYGYAYERLRCR